MFIISSYIIFRVFSNIFFMNFDKFLLIFLDMFTKSSYQCSNLRDNILAWEIKCKKSSFSSNGVFHTEIEVLNDIFDKCKSHGDKRDLCYINKIRTLTSG